MIPKGERVQGDRSYGHGRRLKARSWYVLSPMSVRWSVSPLIFSVVCLLFIGGCVDPDADSPSQITGGEREGDRAGSLEDGAVVSDGMMSDQPAGEEPAGTSGAGDELAPYPQPPTMVSIATYNVQNLFDFVDDPDHEEGEYTPNVANWSRGTYNAKINALAEAILWIDADIIALQEVESEAALTDLAGAIERLGGRRYQHRATSSTRDPRGIALGVLSIHPITREIGRPINETVSCAGGETLDGSRPEARPIYEVNLWSDGSGSGRGGGPDSLTLLVNHWKSRASGDYPCRVAEHQLRGARQLNTLLTTWLLDDPTRSVLVLGDFNATDSEPALSSELDAYLDPAALPRPSSLYNLWGEVGVRLGDRANATTASYRYEGQWFRLDHIFTAQTSLTQGLGRWALERFELIRPPELLRDGAPHSWSNRRQQGYSDHLPLKVTLRRR